MDPGLRNWRGGGRMDRDIPQKTQKPHPLQQTDPMLIGLIRQDILHYCP